MQRREAPTFKHIASKAPDEAARERRNTCEPSFGLLASDSSWRTTWAHIVAGKFSRSQYSGLLFVEHSTGYAELYETDGQGRIRPPFLARHSPLGARATWTHVVSGYFGPSGFTGLLLYDRAAGYGRFYDSDGDGGLVLLGEHSGWRTSWTHVVAGRFDASSPYSSVFFYDADERVGEVWATNGAGLAGNAPRHSFTHGADGTFTHVLAGEFHWTPGYIDTVPTLSDLFFYDARSGRGEMYRSDRTGGGGVVFEKAASADTMPRSSTSVITGNFGGLGNTDVAFYDGSMGTFTVVAFKDTGDTTADIVVRETETGLRRSPTTLAVSGNFWMANEDDHWFNEGPPMSSPPRFDPDWRFGTGTFSDLLIYDRVAGSGEFYYHEPLPPPPEPLAAYITSKTSHKGRPAVSTGSVLPGETIAFHVSSQHGPYTITIYRQGSSQDGEVEQAMGTIEGLPSNPRPFPIERNAYRDGAQWAPVANLVIPDWPSGLYVARVRTRNSPFHTVDVPLAVRAPSAATSGVLLVLGDTSWHAYNDWGGRNSYGYLAGSDFVGAYPSTSAARVPFGFELSFDRPLHGGFGNSPQTWEIPFVQWLARMGIGADVCTARDVHFEQPSTHEYRLLLFVGHPEYWSAQMRTNVEGFAKTGGNVAFFGGNIAWWQIRIREDGGQLACYKVAAFDPVSTTADHTVTTVHWFDDLVKRPETKLTGVSWLGDGGLFYDQDHRYTVKRGDHWVFAGTGLRKNDKFGGYSSSHDGIEDRSVAGAETDRVQTNAPNGLNSPAGYRLASIFDVQWPTLEVGTMGIFKPQSGAGEVFNAATNNWALGLDVSEPHWNVLDQITHNVVARLGWGLSSVAQGKTIPGAPVSAVLTPPERIAVFVADEQGEIYTSSGDPNHGWTAWTSVSQGKTTPGGHVTAALTAPNRVTLFVADPLGGVYTTTGNERDGWAPWTSVSEGSTKPGARVTAIVTAPNRIALFLADPEGGVYTTLGNPAQGWRPWTSVSEGSTTPGGYISAIATSASRIVLFLADPECGVYTTSGNAVQGWRPWTSVSEGSTTPGAPIAAVLTGRDRVAVFLADLGGGVYTTSGNAVQGWRPWTSVSEGSTTPGAPIAAAVTGANHIKLVLSDPGGGIYTTSGNASDGWRPWTRVTHARTTPGAPIFGLRMPSQKTRLVMADARGSIYATTSDLP